MGVLGTSFGLVGEVALFSSEDRSSSFAIGFEASLIDVSVCCCGLAAVAAGCVGGNRRFPPSLCRSPSSILWSGLAVEFVCLLLLLFFLAECEGVGMIDVLERILRDISELLLGQSSCRTRSDQGRVRHEILE
jgi:hypothetical protein